MCLKSEDLLEEMGRWFLIHRVQGYSRTWWDFSEYEQDLELTRRAERQRWWRTRSAKRGKSELCERFVVLGYSVGTFLSPELLRWGERLKQEHLPIPLTLRANGTHRDSFRSANCARSFGIRRTVRELFEWYEQHKALPKSKPWETPFIPGQCSLFSSRMDWRISLISLLHRRDLGSSPVNILHLTRIRPDPRCIDWYDSDR